MPLYPGVSGFGIESPAGRCGEVVKVTSLADDGPGSLRQALSESVPRTVVFEISGTIPLERDLEIHHGFITVAGQSAPSPGITLKGAGIRIYAHDVFIQHLRIRVGDEPNSALSTTRDAIQILGPNAFNIVIDHVSTSWAIDENISTWYPLHDVTISNSIISEALHNSIHPKGPHSNGLLIGDHSRNVAVIGNLLADNAERNPRVGGDTSVLMVNNLVYNHSSHTGWLSVGESTGPSLITAVGNLFIDGPDTRRTSAAISIRPTASVGTGIFMSDNQRASGLLYKSEVPFDPLLTSPPVWHPSMHADASSAVEASVLDHAGARPLDRDEVDLRIVAGVKARNGRVINSPKEVGGWPVLAVNRRTFNLPDNPNGDDNGNGYTNLEELLHDMAAELEGD